MKSDKAITAEDFKRWQGSCGLSAAEAAEALGKSTSSVTIYRKRGIEARDARFFRLAMAAISAGLPPYFGPAR